VNPCAKGIQRPELWAIEAYALAVLPNPDPGAFFVLFFKICVDESGTSKEEENIVLAAQVGRLQDWRVWEDAIYKLQVEFGFERLHSTDLYNELKKHGDVRNLPLLTSLIYKNLKGLEFGTVALLNKAKYEKFYARGKFPDGFKPDSQYALCFRYLMVQTIESIWKKYGNRIKKINFVLERGDTRSNTQAEDVYFDYRNYMAPPRIGSRLMSTLGVEDNREKESRPLFAPDMMARTVLRLKRDGKILLAKPDKVSAAGLAQKIYVLNMHSRGLQHMRTIAIEDYEKRLTRRPRKPLPPQW
jgi:hypothetical protein